MTTIEQRGDLWSTMPGWGIVANLLPPEVVSARRVRVLRKRMLLALIAILVVAAAGYGYAFWQARSAENSLAAEQSRTAQLTTQEDRYAAVTQIHSDVDKVSGQLGTLMAQDVDVPDLIGQLGDKIPTGVGFDMITVNLNASSQSPSGASLSLDTSGKKHIGSVTINGVARHFSDVATFVDALNTVPGVVDVVPITNSVDSGISKFTIQFNLTDEVLSHSFDSSKGGK